MKKILTKVIRSILGATVILLSGCATPSFLKSGTSKGPFPEDTIIKRESVDHNRAAFERIIAAPIRPEPEPEEVLIIEPEVVEIKVEPVTKTKPAGAKYTVQKGDCLCWLAKKYHITLQDLLNANSLDKNAKLFVGQKLILPGITEAQLAELSAGPREYTVQKGDCLSKIARQYGLRVYEIKAANGMTNDRIRAGKKIIIPERGRYRNQKITNINPAKKAKPAFTVDKDGYYTIQKGDILSKIASRAKVSVKDLQNWNNISDPAKIQVGQKIIVKREGSESVPVKPALNSPNSTPNKQETLPVKRYDFMDDGDFFGRVDEIPIVQVHE